ncbi:MAG: hypothetical protein HKN33_01365, partial [Pyrinomonadaceae bacterium]|nr:hypothetical protein [Pyrinomonadaceae bacterium]
MKIFGIVSFVAAAVVAAILIDGLTIQNAQEIKKDLVPYSRFAASDEITDTIRDINMDFYRVEAGSVPPSAKVVATYGRFLIVGVEKGTELRGSAALVPARIDTSINLPNANFEPLESADLIDPVNDLVSPEPDGDYYIVQLGATAKDEWLESIKDAGAEIIQYVPHQAYFVFADGEAIEKVSRHSRVRWVGRYKADQKIAPATSRFAAESSGRAKFDVAVFAREGLLNSMNRIASVDGVKVLDTIEVSHGFFQIVRIETPVENLPVIGGLRNVFRVDPYMMPEREDERAAQIVSGNYSNPTTINGPGYNPLTQFGVDGTNVTVSVVDDGVS